MFCDKRPSRELHISGPINCAAWTRATHVSLVCGHFCLSGGGDRLAHRAENVYGLALCGGSAPAADLDSLFQRSTPSLVIGYTRQ